MLFTLVLLSVGDDDSNRFGGEKFSGGRGGSNRMFPGVGSMDALVVPHDSFTVRFISDGRWVTTSDSRTRLALSIW